MNKIEMLKKQISLIESLIDKTEDEKELKGYKTQIDDINKEIGREEARAEAEEKALKEKEAAEAKALKEKQVGSSINKGIHAQPRIEVGASDYKGYNLKAATLKMKSNDIPMGTGFTKGVLDRMKSNPDSAELVAKWGIDLLSSAQKGPLDNLQKAMNEGTTTAGGYLTPTEERAEVLAYIRETSIAAADSNIISMGSDSMTIPAENAKVTVSFTNEGTAATETTPSFTQVTLTAKKMDAYTIVSKELIDDSINPGGIIGLLTSQFIEAIANKHDSTVFLGTGDPMSSIYTAAAGYSEVFGTGSTSFSAITETNIRNLIAKVPMERMANAKWYAQQAVVWQNLKGIKDTTGRPIYDDYSGGGAVNQTLLGYPVRSKFSNMPATSAVSTGYVAFADLKQAVYIGERMGFSNLFIDPYTLAVQGQVRFILFTRWAYAIAQSGAIGRIVTAAS